MSSWFASHWHDVGMSSLCSHHVCNFGEKPKKTRTPLVAGDHPETDLSELCDQDQIKQYQTINRERVKAHTKGTTSGTIMEKSLLWVP